MPKQSSLTERSLHSHSPSSISCPPRPESIPPSVPLPLAPSPRFDWKTFTKHFIALSLTGAVGFSSGGFFLHVYNQFSLQRQQAQTEALQQARAFEELGDFDRCIEIAESLPTHADSTLIRRECQEKLDQRKLRQATQLTEQGRLAAAIALAREISSPGVSEQAQALILSSSQRMMELMEESYLLGDMAAVAHIARAIDPSNPLYEQVQSRFEEMQYEWVQQQNYLKTAQAYLETDQLNEAIESLQMITHPHWQEQVQSLMEAVYARQATLKAIVFQAKLAISHNDPDRAILLLNSLPETEPWLSEKAALYEDAKNLRRRQIFHQTLAWIVVFFLVISLVGLR